MNAIDFAANVVTLRAKYLFSVTSWGRTVQRNKDVGGVANSYHVLWLGLDVILEPHEKNLDFEADCGRVGLSALWEGDHYHLQPKGL